MLLSNLVVPACTWDPAFPEVLEQVATAKPDCLIQDKQSMEQPHICVRTP